MLQKEGGTFLLCPYAGSAYVVVSMWLVLAPATVINTKIGLDHLSIEACFMA